MFLKRPEWYSKAACKGLPPDLFFSERELGTQSNNTGATQVCRTCPVILECFDYAVEIGEDQYGVWGGFPPKHRRSRNVEKTRKAILQIIESREEMVMTPAARRKRAQKRRANH